MFGSVKGIELPFDDTCKTGMGCIYACVDHRDTDIALGRHAACGGNAQGGEAVLFLLAGILSVIQQLVDVVRLSTYDARIGIESGHKLGKFAIARQPEMHQHLTQKLDRYQGDQHNIIIPHQIELRLFCVRCGDSHDDLAWPMGFVLEQPGQIDGLTRHPALRKRRQRIAPIRLGKIGNLWRRERHARRGHRLEAGLRAACWPLLRARLLPFAAGTHAPALPWRRTATCARAR